MQTECLYHDHTSSSPFMANIIEARRYNGEKQSGTARLAALILDKTIFYPEGGGQGADRGSINRLPLLDVQEKNGEILHIIGLDDTFCHDGEKLQPGPASLILDEKRRRDFSVQHTGQHLLSGTILRITGIPTVSFHMGDEVNTIDVDSQDLSGKLCAQAITEIEELVADAIEADCPVIIHECPPEDINSFPLRKVPPKGEDVLRVVEVKGHDFSPCCGTHCKSTGQIGMLRILGSEKYKSMIRISYIAGRRVLRDSRLLRENALVVSRSLTVPLNETGKGVLAFIEKTKLAEQRLSELTVFAAEVKAASLLEKKAGAGEKILIEVFETESMEEVTGIAKAAQKLTQALLVFASKKDLKFIALCSCADFNVSHFVKEAFVKNGGKGGGGASSFQGFFAGEDALEAFLSGLKQKKEEKARNF